MSHPEARYCVLKLHPTEELLCPTVEPWRAACLFRTSNLFLHPWSILQRRLQGRRWRIHAEWVCRRGPHALPRPCVHVLQR